MKLNYKWLLLALMLTLSVFLVSTGDVGAAIDGGYVGSATCGTCHSSIKADFDKSGHPWKYKHTGGVAPTDPISGLFPTPDISTIQTTSLNDLIIGNGGTPNRLDWSAINYTIGGFGWKIRWGVRDFNQDVDGVNETGYVWAGTQAQYNVETGTWSGYPATLPSNKKYECAICHNTNGIVSTAGYSCFTDGGTDAAPARTEPWASNPGMGPVTKGGYYSSWTFNGVQCEACHGKGSNAGNNGHADLGASVAQGVLSLAGGVEICAKCHIRAENTASTGAECGGDANPAILTNGAKITDPWIGHHEQYNELVGYNGDGAHASLTCTTCHDPHKRAATVISAVATALGITDNNQSAEARGAVGSCQSCHYGKNTGSSPAVTAHNANNVTCIDCHMAEATKTATNSSTAGWGRKADLKTHIFRIDPTGSSIVRSNGFTNIAQNYITPKYACGKCHDSNIYGSVIAGPTSEAEAQTAATGYHTAIASIDNGYVGSDVCGSCHTARYNDFVQSGHPYKIRITDGLTPVDNPTPGFGEIDDPLSALLSANMPLIANLPRTGTTLDSLPNTQIDTNSDGKLDWSSVSYVIGGYGWKARWGIKDTTGDDMTGYVWASPSAAQFNMLAADTTLDPSGKRPDWSAYPNASVTNQTKKYQCATCHNTNGVIINADPDHLDCKSSSVVSERTEPWASTGATYSNHGGFYSEWTFSGVQCEACHGAGLNHATAASTSNIVTNTSKDACGKCHIRATNTAVTLGGKNDECGGDSNSAYLNNGAPSTAGDFNGHHEQYNEMVGINGNGAHASLDCVECHDPHKRSHKVTGAIAGALGITDNNLSAEARGAVASCQSCHGNRTLNFNMGDIKCIDCHMGEITKSATGEKGTWGKMGDVKGHIFRIDPTQTANTTTNAQGKTVATNYVTVDYACGKCHDSSMSTFVPPAMTRSQAMTYAVNIHNSLPTANFTATPDSSTPYKVNFSAASSVCPTGYTCDYDWDFTNDGTYDATGLAASNTYGSGAAVTVKLTVTTNGGTSSSVTKTVTPGTVNSAPVCSSTVTATGMTATVADSSTDPDGNGTATLYVNWGDGSPVQAFALQATGITHTYVTRGTYSVRRYVRDTGGLVGDCGSTPLPVSSTSGTTGTLTVNLDGEAGAAFNVSVYVKLGTSTKAFSSVAVNGAPRVFSLPAADYGVWLYPPTGKKCYTDAGFTTLYVNGTTTYGVTAGGITTATLFCK